MFTFEIRDTEFDYQPWMSAFGVEIPEGLQLPLPIDSTIATYDEQVARAD